MPKTHPIQLKVVIQILNYNISFIFVLIFRLEIEIIKYEMMKIEEIKIKIGISDKYLNYKSQILTEHCNFMSKLYPASDIMDKYNLKHPIFSSIGSLANISGNYSKIIHTTDDTNAIQSDWRVTGSDLFNSIDNFNKEFESCLKK